MKPTQFYLLPVGAKFRFDYDASEAICTKVSRGNYRVEESEDGSSVGLTFSVAPWTYTELVHVRAVDNV
jgi:hypothetical protein